MKLTAVNLNVIDCEVAKRIVVGCISKSVDDLLHLFFASALRQVNFVVRDDTALTEPHVGDERQRRSQRLTNDVQNLQVRNI